MSQAFSSGPSPLGTDLRSAMIADADDVARLLTDLGYPCEIEDAAERIDAIAANDRQALVLARRDGAVCGLVALDFMYYLPLGTITCRVTALVVTPTAQGLGIGRQLLKEAERRARSGGAARIELTSGSQRTEAHAFYRACGYKDSSVRFVKQLGA
ncbi:MAG TPA: GNAT family N-acetyltransferase [Thermomonas sp.]|jgi:GNAT superfamily N-acetyltransferase|uniref:GNAT family N-acetyltransferase n=1 Tax=Thermomonas sp. TaxID=1971895 RepID=UPI002C2EEF6C|nr:GNAT family N-acetyltransferase [Thermomonas sp.]HOU66418.1 GNAT family N-acetyltransferase [Thermomonas sp.]HPM55996.1 GNAT family N-acetyltransferase [Thermomonas sp.]HPW11927.1 GNAT family N-acetyltransferase [Thermomonas sp.]